MKLAMSFLRRAIPILFGLSRLFSTDVAQAGLSGENVALVVNGSSVDSLTVANHYAHLRHVPPQNLIVLDNVPTGLTTSLDEFRDTILRPTFEAINARGLAPQIHVIAYSAGFPTSVDISAHTRRLTDPAQKKYQTPSASINSLTYFYRWVLSDSPDYLAWASNFYARGLFPRHFANPFAGDKREQFQNARDAASEKDYQSAADGFEALAKEHPTLHPIYLLAAENRLQAGEPGKARRLVEQAIRRGWINRRYLLETDPLSTLFQPDDPLLRSLQDVPMAIQGPIAFSSSVGWTLCGHPVASAEGAMPHMLSCSLAVIHENASTLEQAVKVLQRATSADRTLPDATFGFSKTSDVRSTTRMPGVPNALAWLLCRDQSVEIFSSTVPTEKKAYVGMMLGSADTPTDDQPWTLVPGAIAENLTSLGAVFSTTSQTKLTDLLHAGAAISSGAVAEPYALAPKFPSPVIYPFYAEGTTAIEAFYLSINSPYQMLIVGDPLCQPFAMAPNDFVSIERTQQSPVADPPPAVIPTLSVRWQELPDTPVTTPTETIEIYLQGKLVGKTPPVANFDINLPPGAEGEVDLRIILVGQHPTQPKIGFREQFTLGDASDSPRIERLRKDNLDELILFVECKNADRIDVMHGGRVVATIAGSSERLTITAETIGRGPVRLQAVGYRGESAIVGETFVVDW